MKPHISDLTKTLQLLAKSAGLPDEFLGQTIRKNTGLYFRGVLILAVLAVLLPLIVLSVSLVAGWRWGILASAALWAISAILFLLLSAPLGVLLTVLLRAEQGAARRYSRLVLGAVVSGLWVALLFLALPVSPRSPAFPLMILCIMILAATASWFVQRRFIVAGTTVMLVGVTASILHPGLINSFERWFPGISGPGAVRVEVSCEDLLNGRVRLFSDEMEPRYSYLKSQGDTTIWFRSGTRDLTSGLSLTPATPEFVQEEIEACRERHARQAGVAKTEERCGGIRMELSEQWSEVPFVDGRRRPVDVFPLEGCIRERFFDPSGGLLADPIEHCPDSNDQEVHLYGVARREARAIDKKATICVTAMN